MKLLDKPTAEEWAALSDSIDNILTPNRRALARSCFRKLMAWEALHVEPERPKGVCSPELTPSEFRVYMMAFTACASSTRERKYWAADTLIHWRGGTALNPDVGFADALFATARRMAWQQDRDDELRHARVRINRPDLDFITHDEMMRDLDDEEDVDATLRGMDKALGAVCGAEYRREGSGRKTLRCNKPAGHDGDHEARYGRGAQTVKQYWPSSNQQPGIECGNEHYHASLKGTLRCLKPKGHGGKYHEGRYNGKKRYWTNVSRRTRR